MLDLGCNRAAVKRQLPRAAPAPRHAAGPGPTRRASANKLRAVILTTTCRPGHSGAELADGGEPGVGVATHGEPLAAPVECAHVDYAKRHMSGHCIRYTSRDALAASVASAEAHHVLDTCVLLNRKDGRVVSVTRMLIS